MDWGSRAFSFIELTVAIGMMMVVVVTISYCLKSYTNHTKHLQIAGETLDLKAYIRASLDCEKTFKTVVRNNCSGKVLTDNVYVNVLDISNNTIIDKLGSSTIGAWALRAKCFDDNGLMRLVIEAKNSQVANASHPSIRKYSLWYALNADLPLACR